MNLFGCKFCSGKNDGTGDDVACDRKNFDSLLWALVTVFQVPGMIIIIWLHLKIICIKSYYFILSLEYSLCLPDKIVSHDINTLLQRTRLCKKKK